MAQPRVTPTPAQEEQALHLLWRTGWPRSLEAAKADHAHRVLIQCKARALAREALRLQGLDYKRLAAGDVE